MNRFFLERSLWLVPAVLCLACGEDDEPSNADRGNAAGHFTEPVVSESPGTLLSVTEAEELMFKGGDHYSSGEFASAIEIFDQIANARIEGTDGIHLRAMAAHNSGSCYQDNGEPEKSLDYFRRALELDPQYARAHISMGNSYIDMGQKEKAAECYRKSLEVDSNQVDAHYNLANLLEDDAAAIEHYDKAIAVTPDNPVYHHNKGFRLSNLLKNKEAIAALSEAIRLDPAYGLAYYNRGVIYERMGDAAKAEADFSRARELGAP